MESCKTLGLPASKKYIGVQSFGVPSRITHDNLVMAVKRELIAQLNDMMKEVSGVSKKAGRNDDVVARSFLSKPQNKGDATGNAGGATARM